MITNHRLKKSWQRSNGPFSGAFTSYLDERLAVAVNPRTLGATLTGPRLGAYCKYRVCDYRIICDIQDETITILVVKIGNRREVYR